MKYLRFENSQKEMEDKLNRAEMEMNQMIKDLVRQEGEGSEIAVIFLLFLLKY